jgi:hypothetical protein
MAVLRSRRTRTPHTLWLGTVIGRFTSADLAPETQGLRKANRRLRTSFSAIDPRMAKVRGKRHSGGALAPRHPSPHRRRRALCSGCYIAGWERSSKCDGHHAALI